VLGILLSYGFGTGEDLDGRIRSLEQEVARIRSLDEELALLKGATAELKEEATAAETCCQPSATGRATV